MHKEDHINFVVWVGLFREVIVLCREGKRAGFRFAKGGDSFLSINVTSRKLGKVVISNEEVPGSTPGRS
jgi:hypothetical protein